MTATALFLGSFNPIHAAHLMLAQYVLNFGGVDELWFVVSPQNPFKSLPSLASAADRVAMLKLAVGTNSRMAVCDIELRLSLPSYTINTLTVLQQEYPDREFVLTVGGDNLPRLPRWREAEKLLHNRRIIVYPRPGDDTDTTAVEALGGRVELLQAPQMDLSSTQIRQWVADGKDISHYVADDVRDYIDTHTLYRHS